MGKKHNKKVDEFTYDVGERMFEALNDGLSVVEVLGGFETIKYSLLMSIQRDAEEREREANAVAIGEFLASVMGDEDAD